MKFGYRTIIGFSICILCMITLSGCSKSMSKIARTDIEDYIENTMGLTDYTLSNTAQRGITEDGVKKYGNNYFWTVVDNDTDTEFLVNDYFYRIDELDFAGGRDLMNNYDSMLFVQNIYLENSLYDLEYVDCKAGCMHVELYGTYKSREELQALYDEAKYYKDKLAEYNKTIDIPITLNYNPQEIDKITVPVDSIVKHFSNLKKDIDQIYSDMFCDFLVASQKYNIEGDCNLTDEEIALIDDYKYSNGYNRFNKIVKVNENDEIIKEYDLYDVVSYSNAFVILTEEGFEIEGDDTHFSVVNKQGITYEISYDFYEYNEQYDRYDYYVYIDGEKKLLRSTLMTLDFGYMSEWFDLSLKNT